MDPLTVVITLVVMLGIYCLQKYRAHRTKLTERREKEQLEAKKRFEEKLDFLREKRIAVIIRSNDGKILPFENIVIDALLGIGVHIINVPPKDARRIWDEYHYEGTSVFKGEGVDYIIIGKMGADHFVGTPDYEFWFDCRVLLPNLKNIIDSRSEKICASVFPEQHFLHTAVNSLARGAWRHEKDAKSVPVREEISGFAIQTP